MAVALLGILLASPLVIAAGIETVGVSSLPNAVAPVARSAPPMPAAPAGPVSLPDGLPERLPLIATGPSSHAVELAAAQLEDPSPAARTFMACWRSLDFAPNDGDARDGLANVLAAGAVRFEIDTGWQPILREPLRVAMQSAAVDRANAARVNNCAVALFLVGLGDPNAPGSDAVTNEEDATFTVDEVLFADPETLQRSAAELLAAAAEVFDDRELVLNLAFFRDLLLDYEGSTKILREYLADQPEDIGARILLASVLARGITPDWTPQPDGLRDAVSTLAPLYDDPSLIGLVLLAEGDAFIGAADRRVGQSPFVVRDLAWQALDRYDRAIRVTGVPAAYIGRAAALDLLGLPADASEALAAGVGGGQVPVAMEIHRAELAECNGEQAARLESSLAALLPSAPSNVSRLRLIQGQGTSRDRGYLGASVGSDIAPRDVPLAGAGDTFYVLGGDRNAPPEPCLSPITGVDDVLAHAVESAVATRDPDGLATAVARWQSTTGRGLEDGPTSLLAAAAIAFGQPVSEDADPVQSAPDLAAQLAPDDAMKLCRDTYPYAFDEDDRRPLVLCVARAAAEKARSAGSTPPISEFERNVAAAIDEGYVDRLAALDAGLLAEERGDLEAAGERYKIAANDPETAIAAYSRLADLAVARRQFDKAETYLSLAAAVTDSDSYVLSNHGVVWLELARTAPGGAPDCVARQAECAAALDDFRAALATDTANPISLLNTATALRHMGRAQEAKPLYEEVLRIDPTSVPALLDLGLTHAIAGRNTEARQLLLAAHALEPRNPLPLWNLGVLGSKGGLAEALAAQHYLAEATKLDPLLRTVPVQFRQSDVLRLVRLDEGLLAEVTQSGASPLATSAVAVASVAVVTSLAAIFGLVRGEVGTLVREASTFVSTRLTRRKRIGARAAAVLRHRHISPRHVFLAVALFALMVTSAWIVAPRWPAASSTGVLFALTSMLLALATHAVGHRVATTGRTIKWRAQAGPGGWLAALIGLPLGLAAGPFPAERLYGSEGVQRRWILSVAGPVANLLAAAISLAVSALSPLPILRMIAAANLLLAAASLVAPSLKEAHDGSRLMKDRWWLVPTLALVVAVAAASVSIGVV